MKAGGLLVAALVFAVLATANAGGYRYGVSDQAFYAAAVMKDVTPSAFPRDTPLIETQSRLMASDDILAAISRTLGVGLPSLFFSVYLLTLALLFAGAAALGRALGLSWWATLTFLALLTLRHHIERTGANTLEGYMHPRTLAFACGLLALAAVVRGRWVGMVGWMTVAALAHPTTALWFAIVTAVAVGARRAWRRPLIAVAGLALVAGVWAVVGGPLAGRLVTMDATWLGVLADRDYLFPARWPVYAWIVNLAYALVIVLAYRYRRVRGLTVDGERALVSGWLALVVVFLVSVPLTVIPLALAVQLQVNRVFWLLDAGATLYIAWWIHASTTATIRHRVMILGAIVLASAVRGYYVLRLETHRPLVAITLPATPWTDAMRWLTTRPADWNVLADPGHAWKYGVSVRVAAGRDTVLEAGKDPAVALYGRDLAVRVADREAALADFDRLTTADLRRVAAKYAADVLVVERGRHLDLPTLYANAGFIVYDLR